MVQLHVELPLRVDESVYFITVPPLCFQKSQDLQKSNN